MVRNRINDLQSELASHIRSDDFLHEDPNSGTPPEVTNVDEYAQNDHVLVPLVIINAVEYTKNLTITPNGLVLPNILEREFGSIGWLMLTSDSDHIYSRTEHSTSVSSVWDFDYAF